MDAGPVPATKAPVPSGGRFSRRRQRLWGALLFNKCRSSGRAAPESDSHGCEGRSPQVQVQIDGAPGIWLGLFPLEEGVCRGGHPPARTPPPHQPRAGG